MVELLQNGEQNIECVGIYIAEHRKQFPCIAGALEHPIAGVQHRSVWLGLKVVKGVTGLSEGLQKVVRRELFDHFCRMTNLFPESCQNKMPS